MEHEHKHQRDYRYKLRNTKLGGHYHCRLFSKRREQSTWAKCGDLVFAEDEWVSFKLAAFGIALEEEDGNQRS